MDKMILGRVEYASVKYVSDHDYWTCKIGIHFHGFYQNFGCLVLNKSEAYKFGEMMYYLFNPFSNEKFSEENSKSLLNSLIGKECDYGLLEKIMSQWLEFKHLIIMAESL